MLRALAFDTKQFSIPEGIPAHIESAIARDLPELQPAICAHDGTMVIVGSGPSLATFADEIKAERDKGRPIWAVKGAHDWLMERDIAPDVFLSIEPRDRRNNIQHANDTTVYLLASRVCPEVFDHLSGKNVMVWHCASSDDENEVLMRHRKYGIGGMSTSGLRAVDVGVHQGYRNFVMYGMDSCNAPDGITKRIDGSLTGQQQDVIVGGRKFICNVAMAKQAADFQYLYARLPGIHIDVKGDGLLAAINAQRAKQGFAT
jgi:hypothetical protein